MDGIADVFILCVGLFIGILIGLGINKDNYHKEWCQERLTHAMAATDSVKIYRADPYCIKIEP